MTPLVTDIVPGTDAEWCQWVAGPSKEARDLLDLNGSQSLTGHHAVLYSTSETDFPVGESHLCTEDDMLSISFLGAIGGEGTGGSAAALPDGLFFRLPAGRALMANTHWLNATTQTVDGQAVFDLKFAPADSSRQIADLFANNGDSFNVPSGETLGYDVSCTLKADLNIAMSTNHMHTHGVSAYSELLHADGTSEMLVQDDTWASDQQFNPKYNRFGIADAKVAKKGDTIHTHCQWDNTTGTPLIFPAEMCAGVSFYFPGNGQYACSDGDWPQ